jgi:hypothetical protein
LWTKKRIRKIFNVFEDSKKNREKEKFFSKIKKKTIISGFLSRVKSLQLTVSSKKVLGLVKLPPGYFLRFSIAIKPV